MTPGQILTLFDKLGSVLTQFSSSPTFDVPIPLTGKTLGQVINLGTSFVNNITAPLQAVGDASLVGASDLPSDYVLTQPVTFGVQLDGSSTITTVTVPASSGQGPQTIDNLLNAVRPH